MEGIGKKYRIGKEGDGMSLNKRSFFNKIGMKAGSAELWAVKDIDLKLNRGDRLALLGKNGSGKSTLLKLISEISDPTEGKITLRGKVSCLLEIGVGFHHELTGFENIFLYGSLMGMKRKEIDQQFDQLVAFAEVEPLLHTPIKRYSIGMKARLAFSVVSHLSTEILLVDEILSVCDVEFREKALQKMEDLAKRGCAFILVSHDVGLLSHFCNKGIIMENGHLKKQGAIDFLIDEYQNSLR